jgi:NitT/TauT family transport system permease protein
VTGSADREPVSTLPPPGGVGRRVPRPRLGGRASVAAARIGVLAVALAAWQVAAGTGAIDTRTFSEPLLVAERFWNTLFGEVVFQGTIYDHLLVTGRAIAIGYAIGALTGVAAGHLLGRSALVAAVFEPYIVALAAIPKIAIVPVLVMFFGLGEPSEIASVALMVFIAAVFNTFSGVLRVDEELVRLARLMGAKRLTVVLRVIIPAAMPSIMIGLRTGVPFAMIGAITAEFVASTEGLGWAVQQASATFDPTSLFAIVAYLVLLTAVVGQVVAFAQRRALRWQPRP